MRYLYLWARGLGSWSLHSPYKMLEIHVAQHPQVHVQWVTSCPAPSPVYVTSPFVGFRFSLPPGVVS